MKRPLVSGTDITDTRRPAGVCPRSEIPLHARAQLRRLVDTSDALQSRLHRVTVALALSQDAVAELLEHLADDGSPAQPQLHMDAMRARAAATECREFARRLEELAAAAVDVPAPGLM